MTLSEPAKPRSDGEKKPAIPSISLPKGGGAIRGTGEKFAANPVTGTGSMSVPIATSPGRSGFGPQLSLSYFSGSGNGKRGDGVGGTGKDATAKGVPLTELDYATLLASLFSPMGSEQSKEGFSDGIPGGKRPKSNASGVGQCAYIAINLLFTFASGLVESGLRKAWSAVKPLLKQALIAPTFMFMGAGGIVAARVVRVRQFWLGPAGLQGELRFRRPWILCGQVIPPHKLLISQNDSKKSTGARHWSSSWIPENSQRELSSVICSPRPSIRSLRIGLILECSQTVRSTAWVTMPMTLQFRFTALREFPAEIEQWRTSVSELRK